MAGLQRLVQPLLLIRHPHVGIFGQKNGPLYDQMGSSNTARLIVISQDIFRKFVGCAFLCIPHVKKSASDIEKWQVAVSPAVSPLPSSLPTRSMIVCYGGP